MKYNLQNNKMMELDTIVLDLNGTLSIHGKLIKGVKKKLLKLKNQGFYIHILTGDQRGTASDIAKNLGVEFNKTKSGKEKGKMMDKLGKENIVSIGNSRIDIEMFKKSKLSILTLQGEGIHPETIKHVDIIVPSILDALDLLLYPDSLAATLKK